MRWKDDRAECALCSEPLVGVTETSNVRIMLVGASGQQNARAILVDGKEVHRCPSRTGRPSDDSRDRAAAARRSANRSRAAADEGGRAEARHRRDARRHDDDADRHEADAAAMQEDERRGR